ncbi:MAG: DUF945 family protein [Gammaproteobacteria bacterium]|nr:DUF945 family protein [Gammaproteobacteria bacterium]
MTENEGSNFQPENQEKPLLSSPSSLITRFKDAFASHKLSYSLSGLIILYLSIYFFIGYKIESSIQNYADELSNSRLIDIYQLDYDRGIFGGIIRYDFIVSPSQVTDDVLADYFPTLSSYSGLLNLVDDFRLNGEIPISQGPLNVNGFNIMNGDISILPTPFIRSLLPSLSNRTPIINISFALNFFNNLNLDINLEDYSGSLNFDSDQATLETRGINLSLGYNLDSPPGENASFEIDEISLGIDEDSVTLNSLNLLVSNSRIEGAKYVSEGEGLFSIESIQIVSTEFDNTPFNNPSLENLSFSAIIEVDEEYAEYTAGYSGEFKPDNLGSDTYSYDFVFSLENIDYLAIDQILEFYFGDELSSLEVLTSEIIKAGPIFNIDEFSLGINNSFISLEGYISHPASSQAGLVSIDQVPLRLGVDFSLEITGNFIEEAIQTYITTNQDEWTNSLGVTRNQINDISDLISVGIYNYFDELELSRSRNNVIANLALNNQQIFLGTNLIFDFDDPSIFYDYFQNENFRFSDAINETMLSVNEILYPQEENGSDIEASNDAFLETLINIANDVGDNVSSVTDSVQTKSNEAASPDKNTSNASYGEHTLIGGFTADPYLVSVVAGGNVDISTEVQGCLGNVNFETPDVILNYTPASFTLYVSSTSEGDATLAILTPDGSWHCNDDTSGLNPGIEFPKPIPGLYSIWIGTYGGSNINAELRISETSLF